MISAAAGTGKTRALVEQITQIVAAGNSLDKILVVTFTTKAATELKKRLKLLGETEGMWIGTFHSLALRILNAENPTTINVLNGFGQKKLLQQHAGFKVDEYLDAIENFKNTGQSLTLDARRVYEKYEAAKLKQGLLDYTDLILRSTEILSNPQIQKKYTDQFHFVLVDEYQDTNPMQQKWLQQIAPPRTNLFCVGDEDQAIFGWRGSDPHLMTNFRKNYPSAKISVLDVNYRSTGNIVAAAKGVINHNQHRIKKNFRAHREMGQPVYVYRAHNRPQETEFAIEWLQKNSGTAAVICRTLAQLQPFELLLEQQKPCSKKFIKLLKEAPQLFFSEDSVRKFLKEKNYEMSKEEEIELSFCPDSMNDLLERIENRSKKISLLTIHASKGLEFDNVVLPGWEEGIIPHGSAISEGNIEEERRLAYVAMTRARERLLLTYQKPPARPSRFLEELNAGSPAVILLK